MILSKKSSENKYNQNYNINFFKNNCYNNNFVSLFQKEEIDKNKININNNNIDSNKAKKEKQKTSLIMSVLNDFNFVNTKI